MHQPGHLAWSVQNRMACSKFVTEDVISVADDASVSVPGTGTRNKGYKKANDSQRSQMHQMKKGKKWCKGCGLYKDIASFPVKGAMDLICKRAWNNITLMGERQGEKEYLAEVFADHDKLQAITRCYNDHAGVTRSSTRPPIRPPTRPPIRPSIRPPIRPPTRPPTRPRRRAREDWEQIRNRSFEKV